MAKIRQAAILVGGLGTRLGSLTASTPKPLLPCGDRPFLHWLIRELCRFGIEEILLLCGHLSHEVEKVALTIAARLPEPVQIVVCREEGRAGTGGALRQAYDRLDGNFQLINGDSWLDWNLANLLADFANDDHNVDCRIVLRYLADARRSGVAELKDDLVVAFHKRPVDCSSGYANAGIYILRRSVIETLDAVCSLEGDVLPALAAKGSLRGTIGAGYFIDIGIPEDYERSQSELPAHLMRPALFLDRDGVINRDLGWVGQRDHWEWIPGAVAACREAADAGWHVFVVTNQSGIARGYYDELQFQALSSWMIDEIRRGRGNVDSLRYCPNHPNASILQYRLNDRRRKPGPGMIEELINAWELDPTRCKLIGDQITDLEAAAACGVEGFLFDGDNLLCSVRSLMSNMSA